MNVAANDLMNDYRGKICAPTDYYAFADRVDPYLELGNSLLSVNNLSEAEKVFWVVRKKFPNFSMSYNVLSKISELKGESALAHLYNAEALFYSFKFEEAESILQIALANYPTNKSLLNKYTFVNNNKKIHSTLAKFLLSKDVAGIVTTANKLMLEYGDVLFSYTKPAAYLLSLNECYEAFKILKSACKKHPYEKDIYELLISVATQCVDVRLINRVAVLLLKGASEFSLLYSQIALICIKRMPNYDLAEYVLKKGLAQSPKDAQLHHLLIEIYEAQNKQREARETTFNKALEFLDNDENVKFVIEWFAQGYTSSKTIATLKSFIQRYEQTTAYYHLYLGLLHVAEDKFRLAKNCFKKTLELSPDLDIAAKFLVCVYQRLNNVDELRVLAGELSRKYPKQYGFGLPYSVNRYFSSDYAEFGKKYLTQFEEADTAYEVFSDIINQYPLCLASYPLVFKSLVKLKRFCEAKCFSEKMIKKFPDDVEGYECLSKILLHTDKYEDCLSCNDLIISKFPYRAHGYLGKAYCLMKLSEHNAAHELVEYALSNCEDKDDLYNFLVKEAMYQRKYTKVIFYSEKLKSYSKFRYFAIVMQANVFLRLGDEDKAKQLIHQLNEIDRQKLRAVVANQLRSFTIERLLEGSLDELMKLVPDGALTYDHPFKLALYASQDEIVIPLIHMAAEHVAKFGARFLVATQSSVSDIPKLSAEEKYLSCKKLKEVHTNLTLQNEIWGNLPHYDNKYHKKVAKHPKHRHTSRGVVHVDHKEEYVNVIDGYRLTAGTPNEYSKMIYVFGNSKAFSYGCEDKHTLPSCLQNEVNNSEKLKGCYCVCNLGVTGLELSEIVYKILKSNFNQDDVVLLHGLPARYENLIKNRFNSSITCISSPSVSSDEIIPTYCSESHFSYHGQIKYAKVICKQIEDELNNKFSKYTYSEISTQEKILGENVIKFLTMETVKNNKESFCHHILEKYLETLDKLNLRSGRTGAIVMNCNPFTNGHLYLIESAAKEVDNLIVFVVEEDKSYFKFKDRLSLVIENTNHIDNVVVVPGGRFVISTDTFPDYFVKEYSSEVSINACHDLDIFAEYIAPRANISVRFVGEEPYCNTTSQYNRQMQHILPQYGIRVRVFERKAFAGDTISASLVRKYLSEGRYEDIREIVPPKTFAFLNSVEFQ